MKSLALVILISLAAGCSIGPNNNGMFKIFKKKDPIENFWQWFTENEFQFDNLTQENVKEKLDLIGNHLRKISDGLVVEVSKNHEGFRDLTISAEGDKEKFPIVREIVDKAPQIRGWTVTAFRQRANIAFILETDSIKYNTAEMFFQPLIEGDEFDLIVYAENLKDVDEKTAFHFGMIVMDNLLGEYDSVMKVRRYDFRDLNQADDKSKLKPLTESPKFVDDFYRKTNN